MRKCFHSLTFVCAALAAAAADIPSAANYARSGLIGLWDGVENAGARQHDAARSSWADLSGKGHDIDMAGTKGDLSAASFGESAVTVPNGQQLAVDLGSALSASADHTAEIRARFSDGFVGNDKGATLIALGYDSVSGKGDGTDKYWIVARVKTSSTEAKNYGWAGYEAKYRDYGKAYNNKATVVSDQSYSAYFNATGWNVLINGSVFLSSSLGLSPFWTDSLSSPNTKLVVGNGKGQSEGTKDKKASEVISSIRLYSGKLSDEARAYNLMLDGWRFGGKARTEEEGWRLDGDGVLRVRLTLSSPFGTEFSVNGDAPAASHEVWVLPGVEASVTVSGGDGPRFVGLPRGSRVSGATAALTTYSPVAATVTFGSERPDTTWEYAIVGQTGDEAVCTNSDGWVISVKNLGSGYILRPVSYSGEDWVLDMRGLTNAFAAIRKTGNTTLSVYDYAKVLDGGSGTWRNSLREIDMDGLPIAALGCDSDANSCPFYKCAALERVTLSRRTVTIMKNVFVDCSSLEAVSPIDQITTLEGPAFSNCPLLAFDYGLADFSSLSSLSAANVGDVLKDCPMLADVRFGGDGVETLSAGPCVALRNCEGVTNVTYAAKAISSLGVTHRSCAGLRSVTIRAKSLARLDYNFSAADGTKSLFHGCSAAQAAVWDCPAPASTTKGTSVFQSAPEGLVNYVRRDAGWEALDGTLGGGDVVAGTIRSAPGEATWTNNGVPRRIAYIKTGGLMLLVR